MRHARTRLVLALPFWRLALSLLALGCGGGTDLEDPEHIAAWANSASALAVFLPAYDPLLAAEGGDAFEDPACPTQSDDGTTLVLTGGCTDSAGRQHVGSASVTRGEPGDYDLSLDGWGAAEEDPAGVTGTFAIRQMGDGSHEFAADYTQDSLLTLDVVYDGNVQGGFDGATVWTGNGTVERGGFTDASGTATATTSQQRRDPDVCSNQSASGSTTIGLDGRVLVITYDGATDCDDAQTALARVDGVELGAVPGITCAARPGAGRGGLWAGLLVGLGALVAARRRGAHAPGDSRGR